MRKRVRKHKIMPFWWAEVFVFVLIGILFFMLFQMDKESFRLQERSYQNQMQSGIIGAETRYYGDTDMTKAEVRDYLYDVVMQYIPTYSPSYGNSGATQYPTSRIGFAAGFYDADGNVIVETRERNILIHYNIYDEEQEKYIELYSNLEDYFSESYVDRFVEHCQHSGGIVSISYVEGYFTEEKEFVLTGMKYKIEKEGEEPECQEIKVTTDIPKSQIIHEENYDQTMYIKLYNEKQTQNKRELEQLHERMESERISNYRPCYIYEGFVQAGGSSTDDRTKIIEITGGGIYGYVYYGTPLNKFTITSPTFWAKFVFLAAVIQVGMLILYTLYREIMEKQQELDRMRNTFLNAIAHEMKTPAAVIKNSTECIKENVFPEKNERYLDMISDEADHMNALVSQMLMYTRTSEGVYELRLEQVSLMDLVQSVCQTYKLQMEEKGIQLTIQHKGKQQVSADAVLIKTVIDNFISNAVRYGAEHGAIEVVVNGKQFSIYNDGKALSAEEQRKIWEPLYVIDEARSKTDGSAGMGLAICKNILELHDAKYGVENVDNGVRFYFTLP